MAVFEGKIIFGKRRILNLIYSFLFVYALVLLFLFFNQRHFFYYPVKNIASPAEAGVPEMQVIAVQPKGMQQSIQGWYAAPASADKAVVLYFHGNGGGIDIRASRVSPLIKEGYGVLLAEYRGYSGNPGKPTERGLYADAEAYYAWLLDQGIAENQIVIYGESIGSGPATYLASKNWNARGLILDAPFTSFADVIQGQMFFVPVGLILRDRYSNIDRIANINMPLLIMHGERDNVVSTRLGIQLYNAANGPKKLKLFSEGGHSDLYNFGAGQAVLEFLQADTR